MNLDRLALAKGQKYMIDVSKDVGDPDSVEIEIILVPPRGPIRGKDRWGTVHLFMPDQIEAKILVEDHIEPVINIFALEVEDFEGECYVLCRKERKRTKENFRTPAYAREFIKKVHRGEISSENVEWIKYLV